MDGVGDVVETSRSYVFLLNKDILSLLPGGTWSSLPALGCKSPSVQHGDISQGGWKTYFLSLSELGVLVAGRRE